MSENNQQNKKKSNIALIVVIIVVCIVLIVALLIGVMLISTGILMYNRAAQIVASEPISSIQLPELDDDETPTNSSTNSSTTSSAFSAMNSLMVSAYNSKYENYAGEDVSASQVKSMIGLVKSHNEDEVPTYPELILELYDADGNGRILGEFDTTDINSGVHYRIELDGFDEEGYVIHISITEL